jgi:hypothetical protein
VSDSYEALVNCGATPIEAARIRASIVECLFESGLIVPTLSADCVLDGEGIRPAPARTAARRPVFTNGSANRTWASSTWRSSFGTGRRSMITVGSWTSPACSKASLGARSFAPTAASDAAVIIQRRNREASLQLDSR